MDEGRLDVEHQTDELAPHQFSKWIDLEGNMY
jgi:hypothetical protein